jgi:hypothetical protein
MQLVLKKLSDMAVNYMRQKDLSSINLQTAAALLATFIKKGRGEYIVIDT